MKLNPDCIRDILLLVEQETSLEDSLDIESCNLPASLSAYSPEEVMYHIKQCELSGLLFIGSWYFGGDCSIRYLSPEGHQFLSDIREDNNWNKTKEIASSVGSNSLDVIKDIASGVIAALIQSALKNL